MRLEVISTYEIRADELGKFQDLCQHVGVRKGQTVDDCKAVSSLSPLRSITSANRDVLQQLQELKR